MATPTIAPLGNGQVPLRPPQSLAQCYDLLIAAQTSPLRANAAALGLCWVGPGRPKAKFEATYSALAYGGQVLDELLARGLTAAEVTTAGVIAYGLVCGQVVGEQEVKADEDFSEAPGESISR